MNNRNRIEQENILAEQILELVLEHKTLHVYCDAQARDLSGTWHLDEQGMEAIEDTAQHTLYWAEYVRVQSRIVNVVLGKVIG